MKQAAENFCEYGFVQDVQGILTSVCHTKYGDIGLLIGFRVSTQTLYQMLRW